MTTPRIRAMKRSILPPMWKVLSPTTQRTFHQLHSKPTLPGSAFLCAEFPSMNEKSDRRGPAGRSISPAHRPSPAGCKGGHPASRFGGASNRSRKLGELAVERCQRAVANVEDIALLDRVV